VQVGREVFSVTELAWEYLVSSPTAMTAVKKPEPILLDVSRDLSSADL